MSNDNNTASPASIRPLKNEEVGFHNAPRNKITKKQPTLRPLKALEILDRSDGISSRTYEIRYVRPTTLPKATAILGGR